MLLYFLITCLSFYFFAKSLSLPPWISETKTLLSFYFSKNPFMNIMHPTSTHDHPPSPMVNQMSVLDLPDLALDHILDLLPPSGLCSMARTCSSLRERCVSDHLWEKHLQTKWGKILGPAARREWQSYSSSIDHLDSHHHQTRNPLRFAKIVSLIRSFSSVFRDANKQRKIYESSLPLDSTMSCYLSLETGHFWFPAQVYNRENGHVGFMLSCYDAELSYDTHTDTFQARYPPHGRRAIAIEKNVTWERLRAAPIDASPHHLHMSNTLNELKPGDHIEIQWRRNKEFPYGWWYGVVGHLESCDGNLNHCHCHLSEMVVLEFNQYTVGSRWRRTLINRRDHREEGNEEYGFYGGIRKLNCKQEIAMWNRLWPSSILE